MKGPCSFFARVNHDTKILKGLCCMSECMKKSCRNALFIAPITSFSKLHCQNDSKFFSCVSQTRVSLGDFFSTKFLKRLLQRTSFLKLYLFLTLFRLRSITFHFETFWCLMYSVLCLKRDLSVIICKRTTHGVFSALMIRKMSNVTFGAASGIFFFLRKNQTKSTRRPIWFHILRIFFFSAFWSCLGVYQHLRNFGNATSYLPSTYVTLATLHAT